MGLSLLRSISLACSSALLVVTAVAPLAQVPQLSAPPVPKPAVRVEDSAAAIGRRAEDLSRPFGAGAVRIESMPGLTKPVPISKPVPGYTRAAMGFGVQGSVDIEAIVGVDGRVGDLRIVKSLDDVFGMDAEAVKAAKRWTFRPGRDPSGRAVPFIVVIGFDLKLNGRPLGLGSPDGRLDVSGPRGASIVAPRRVSGTIPVYPDAARLRRIAGTVVVEAYTNLGGEVVFARVTKSVPECDATALAAVRTWKYTQTLLRLEPTETLVTVKIRFDPSDVPVVYAP